MQQSFAIILVIVLLMASLAQAAQHPKNSPTKKRTVLSMQHPSDAPSKTNSSSLLVTLVPQPVSVHKFYHAIKSVGTVDTLGPVDLTPLVEQRPMNSPTKQRTTGSMQHPTSAPSKKKTTAMIDNLTYSCTTTSVPRRIRIDSDKQEVEKPTRRQVKEKESKEEDANDDEPVYVAPSQQKCYESSSGATTSMLVCPPGMMINDIGFAAFGSPQGSCAADEMSMGECTTDISKQVASLCLHNEFCHIPSNFTDGCSSEEMYTPGDNNNNRTAPRRTLISYECAPIRTRPVVAIDYKCKLSHGGESTMLQCPHGGIISHFGEATFGVLTGSCEHGIDASASNDTCRAGVVPMLTTMCVGQSNCTIEPEKLAALPNCQKPKDTYRLMVDYACAPKQTVGKCAIFKDNFSNGTLMCPSSLVVGHVDFAYYGAQSGTCGTGIQPSSNCTKNIMADVLFKCRGKQLCVFDASTTSLGKPCETYHGDNNSHPVLSVSYQCVSPDTMNSTYTSGKLASGRSNNKPNSASSMTMGFAVHILVSILALSSIM